MVFMRFLVLLLPVLFLCPAGAMAQSAPQRTADADAPTESHLAAALDLLSATHAADLMKTMMDTVLPEERRVLKAAAPTLSDQAIDIITQKLAAAVIARQDELLHIQALEYCRYFDEEDLHQLAAFYRSELGQRYISTVPEVVREMTPLVQQWMRGVVAQTQEDILRSMPKQNDKS